NPELVRTIYRRVRESLTCPVLMKLRIGYDDSAESRENFWRIVESAAADGIDALIIHGRLVKQKYTGKADWEILAEVKRRFPAVTTLGSGDSFSPATVVQRLAASGVDGISIARGAVGNPWISAEAQALIEGRPKPAPPTVEEQGQAVLGHFRAV